MTIGIVYVASISYRSVTEKLFLADTNKVISWLKNGIPTTLIWSAWNTPQLFHWSIHCGFNPFDEPNVFESKLELNLSELMYQKDYLRQTSSFKTAKKHREWFIIRPGAEPESETAVSKPQCCMNEKKNRTGQTKQNFEHCGFPIDWCRSFDILVMTVACKFNSLHYLCHTKMAQKLSSFTLSVATIIAGF